MLKSRHCAHKYLDERKIKLPSQSRRRPVGGVAFSLTDFPTGYLRVEQGTPWSGDRGLWEGLPPWAAVGIQWLLSLDSVVSLPLCRCAHGVLLKLYPKKERDWLPVQGCARVGWGERCHNFEGPSEKRWSKSAFHIGSVVKGSFTPPNLHMSVPASLVSGCVM